MTLSPVQKLCESESAVILSGASLSGAIQLIGRIPAGLYMPATWTAAVVTFSVSLDGVTYYKANNSSGEVSRTVVASDYMALDPADFYGINFIKIRSGTAASAVAQGADRTLILMCGVPSRSQ
jgi:hypothetical protein